MRLGLLSFFLLLGHLRPRPRPLTPDPPLLPGRAVTADPNLSTPWCRESEPEQPLSPLQGSGFVPHLPRSGVWYSLGSAGGAFRPLPTLGSRLGPQAPPPRAPRSLILALPGLPPAPRVFPSPPLAAVTGNGAQIFGTPGVRKGRERGPQGPACFVVMMEPLQPGGGARPS